MIYKDEYLREISFPLGGIGTGSVGLGGDGRLIDWEIFNSPDKGSINGFTFFAVKAMYPDGKCVVKVLHGDAIKDFVGQYMKKDGIGYGVGPQSGTMCGFPHFKSVTFNGKFPIAELTFEDDEFPATVVLNAFNPFIPLDDRNSSIPAAFFDISVEGHIENVEYTVVFSLSNPFEKTLNFDVSTDNYKSVILKNAKASSDELDYGELCVAVDTKNGFVQEYWYRGQWSDNIQTFWHELTNGSIAPRSYTEEGSKDVCSVGASAMVNANEKKEFRFVLSWNIPNNYCSWAPFQDENGKEVMWKNYYATIFPSAADSCKYSLDNWEMLWEKTMLFCDALHSSTLDPVIIDAVSSNLAVLKSPTVLRLEDGTIWAWEGVYENTGSCFGTCTHVWNYAYAMCFLYPKLERSLREFEFKYDVNSKGYMRFRTPTPVERAAMMKDDEEILPCLDGQMGTVIKAYREWKISGDTAWLRKNWDKIKLILEFAWSADNKYEWDKDRDGVLEGRQHHTLDMELFGPSAWLEGLYLAALRAAAEMAEFLGEPEKHKEYTELFNKGYKWMKENLFNGEYFIQLTDLKNKAYTEHFDCPNYWNEEKNELKYQIAEGCEIDQTLAQWHANICGLGDIFDKGQLKKSLRSILKYNFKKSMRNYANAWRVFALNDEKGTIMCDYPAGAQKPIIPIPYVDECMTGFEYAFAGLLISEGLVNEGTEVVRAIRDRYDGKKRNPWNEIECGSNYARAMASYALIPILSGFEFDLPKQYIGFSPVAEGDFKCLWSLDTGWGMLEQANDISKIKINDGYLVLSSVKPGKVEKVSKVYADGKQIRFTYENNVVKFDTVKVEKELIFKA